MLIISKTIYPQLNNIFINNGSLVPLLHKKTASEDKKYVNRFTNLLHTSKLASVSMSTSLSWETVVLALLLSTTFAAALKKVLEKERNALSYFKKEH